MLDELGLDPSVGQDSPNTLALILRPRSPGETPSLPRQRIGVWLCLDLALAHAAASLHALALPIGHEDEEPVIGHPMRAQSNDCTC